MVRVGIESENLWQPAKIPASQCDRSPIPGTDIVIPLMAGDVSRAMKAFIADFHAFVESLYNARGGTDEGGWTPTNSVNTSNHLNGTAADLNWDDHTFRVSLAGFTPAEEREMRLLLSFYNFEGLQIIFWAQDWDNPKDCMHIQMGYGTYANRDKLRRFVEKFIRPDGFSTYRRGGGLPSAPRKAVVPGPDGTFWADVSQYQTKAIDSSYPFEVFSFRTNSGDKLDTLAEENALRAKSMLEDGKLQIVIPYYFFRPGQANCDLHREILEKAGLFNHPRTVSMVDVEGGDAATGFVTGDNTWEINDEVNRIRKWYGAFERVIGYWNPNADPGLWLARGGLNLVIPQYNRVPGDISGIKDAQVRSEAFAHQFTSSARDVAPWTNQNIDKNWTPYNTKELLVLFGMEKPTVATYPSDTQMLRDLWDRLIRIPWHDGKWPSRAIFRDSDDGVDDTVGMLLNTDGNSWDTKVVVGAMLGEEKQLNRIRRVARGEGPAGDDEGARNYAKSILRSIEGEKEEGDENA